MPPGFGGAPCPVYATKVTWQALRRYPVREREVAEPRKPQRIGGIGFEAFDLEHSLRAPAVGYRITAGTVSLFYAPDVVSIHDQNEALAGISLYVGDGAAVTRAIIRHRDGRPIWPRLNSHTARLVQRGGRAARDLHTLRLGDRPRP